MDSVEYQPPGRALSGRAMVIWLVVVLGAAVAAGLWMTSPKAFARPSNGGGMRVRVGADANTMTSIEPSRPVTVVGVSPVVRAGSANADIVVRVCEGYEGGGRLGTMRGDLRERCDHVYPPEGVVLPSVSGQVIVTVTPREPGRVQIDGFQVWYRQGWRSGVQTTGNNVTIDARRR